MAAPRILLIEDEPAIADTLLYALRTEGFAPEWRSTGRDGLAALEKGDTALVILDVGLPDVNGFELCKTIRTRFGAVPILFLTARNAEVDRIVGLEIGGDDYVTKPFSPREVTARVKAILRRGPPSTPPPAVCHPLGDIPPENPPDVCHLIGDKPAGDRVASERPRVSGAKAGGAAFAVDAERCEVRFHGVRLELTRYEYRLLSVLVARPGRVFSRDELMAQAWEDPGASLDRTVDAHIKTLRAKLRAIAPDADPIRTHRGLGYALRVTS